MQVFINKSAFFLENILICQWHLPWPNQIYYRFTVDYYYSYMFLTLYVPLPAEERKLA